MNRHLRAQLELLGDVGRYQALTAPVGRHVLERAVGAGDLLRVLPEVYAWARTAQEREVRLRAALLYFGEVAALSHATGLELWGVRAQQPGEAIHVTGPSSLRRRARRDLVVPHRMASFDTTPGLVVVRRDLRVLRLEECLLRSWAVLPPDQRREPVIASLRDRRTSVARLMAAANASVHLKGVGEFRELVELVGGGCHSELEIYGFLNVFNHPSLPRATRQVPVHVNGRVYYVDLGYEEVKVGVELDGQRDHDSTEGRERDNRRDVALAMAGWQMLRFTGRRLWRDPRSAVEEVRAVCESRRRLFGLWP